MSSQHNHPFYVDNPSADFSYTNNFEDSFNLDDNAGNALQVIERAKNAAAVNISNKGRNGKAVAQMVLIKNAALKSEQAFLQRHGFTDGGNNWSDLITGINYILGNQASFERNINLLAQVANGERSEYRDVSKFFMGYLEEEVYKAFDKLSLTADMGEVALLAIQNAIKRMQKLEDTEVNGKVKTRRHSEKRHEKALYAFNELYGQIEVIRDNIFFQKIVELFRLDSFIENVRTQLLTNLDADKKLQTNPKGGRTRYSGSLQEILDSAINSQMNFQTGSGTVRVAVEAKQIGGFNFKPDVILADINQPLHYEELAQQSKAEEKSKSVRAAGVKTMAKLYANLKQAKGEIVLISDKNYVINKAFKNGGENYAGGFAAQGKTTLNNLQALFNAIDVKGINVPALINYLANVGDGMIVEDVDESILKTIATQAADFLFDDASLSVSENILPSGVNVIHVFNLSGIYVPLSFILDGMIGGLKGAINYGSYQNYVEVEFNSGTSDPGKGWKEKDFERFRQKRMSSTNISVHFLKDFARIITEAINV